MKRSVLIAACLGVVAVAPISWGVLPPASPELPNLDKRTSINGSAAIQSARRQALEKLRAGLPGAGVDWDPILGTPRFVTAANGYLTGTDGIERAVAPNALLAVTPGDSNRVIKVFLNEHAGLFGHNAGVLASARVKRDYVTAHNGLRTVIWEQMLDGIPVYEGLLVSHVTKRGELVSVSSRFVPDAVAAANSGTPGRATLIDSPAFSAADSLVKAAADLGTALQFADLTPGGVGSGPEQAGSFNSPLLRGEARTRLVWLPMNGASLRLCWRVELTTRNQSELYSLVVDARDGEVLVRKCLTKYATPVSYNVFTGDSPSPFSPGWPTPNTAQPPLVQRRVETLTAVSSNASPNGWIDDAGTNTAGNNVEAHLDRNADNLPDLPRPSSTNRLFDFPLDLTQSPATYGDAAVVQLFYWNNFMHDKLYELGFTEAAGNFQSDNFGRGGQGNDAVQADAQDGSGTDNANFSTPPDGQAGRMQMYIFSGPNPTRDGDLDAEVILHEYAHGLSDRLVGGGVGLTEVQSAGLGEGWSDFYALSLLSEENDDVHAQYPMGGYLTYRLAGRADNYYYGIRRYPYTTDMSRNPLTFKDIDPNRADAHLGVPISPIFGGSYAAEAHAMGEVWGVTLWDARANLIDRVGYDAGNATILRLVTDGMKLSPPNPNFLEARDAILSADLINNGGDNRAALWIAFARRGMGVNAVAPPASSPFGVVEDFTLPEDVGAAPTDGVLEISVTPVSGAVVLAGTTEPVIVQVSDGVSLTNASIVTTLNGTPGPVFRINGFAPGGTASNAFYGADMLVPTNSATATLALVISAPGKQTATNVVSYVVVPRPANDLFADSIQVPVNGAFYPGNNKLATIEINEPIHAGLTNQAGSLWWSWSSGVATNVLVDTAGSSVDTLIGVYSGNEITGLTRVTSTNDLAGRRQAFVNFDAVAGTDYRIAIASINSNSLGSIHLLVAPGQQADAKAPVLFVTSPSSGFTSTSNSVLVTGVAIEPGPYASGISQINIRVVNSLGGDVLVMAAARPESLVESTNWSQNVSLVEGLNTLWVTASDVAGNLSLPVTLAIRYLPPDPVNDRFDSPIVLTNDMGASTVNTTHATREPGEPPHANNSGGKSAWWSFRPSADGVLTLTTTNSSFDTLLAVYQGTRVDGLTTLASNDNASGGSVFSTLSLVVRRGLDYRIAVDGVDGDSGVVLLGYSLDLQLVPPVIQLLDPTPTGFQIQVQSSLVSSVVVQSSTDLVSWQSVSTNSVTGPTMPYTYPQPATDQARFYRVVTP